MWCKEAFVNQRATYKEGGACLSLSPCVTWNCVAQEVVTVSKRERGGGTKGQKKLMPLPSSQTALKNRVSTAAVVVSLRSLVSRRNLRAQNHNNKSPNDLAWGFIIISRVFKEDEGKRNYFIFFKTRDDDDDDLTVKTTFFKVYHFSTSRRHIWDLKRRRRPPPPLPSQKFEAYNNMWGTTHSKIGSSLKDLPPKSIRVFISATVRKEGPKRPHQQQVCVYAAAAFHWA